MDVKGHIQLYFDTFHKQHVIDLINTALLKIGEKSLSIDKLVPYKSGLCLDATEYFDALQSLRLAEKVSDPGIGLTAKTCLKTYVIMKNHKDIILTDDFYQGKHCLKGYDNAGNELVFQNQKLFSTENIDLQQYYDLLEIIQRKIDKI